MTDEQQVHIECIVSRFNTDALMKYMDGQKEHGGDLWRKPGLVAEAYKEAVDLIVYLDTVREQHERMKFLAKAALEKDDLSALRGALQLIVDRL
jgi:hypothetical protein